jgi:hypothetical protein
MFIDTDKVGDEPLDFTPSNEPLEPEKFRFKHVKHRSLRVLLRRIFLSDRRAIGYSQDTGYRLYARYAHDAATRSECFIPVFKPYLDAADGELFFTRWDRVLDKALPDHLSFVPKRREYFTEVGFFDISTLYPTSRSWEQFMWEAQPFGFHLRGYRQKRCDPDGETRAIRTLLDTHVLGMTRPG